MDFFNDNLVIIDPELETRIKSVKKAELLLDEILNDPMIDHARIEAATLVNSYSPEKRENAIKSESFIKNALSGCNKQSFIPEENKNAKIEITKGNINELSAEWVREWHKKKQSSAVSTPADLERKNFISASLEDNTDHQPEQDTGIRQLPGRKVQMRNRTLHFTGLAAAAAICCFFTIKSLLPVDSSELFNTHYKSYQAVGITVRGNSENAGVYSEAINNFKSGDYINAEAGFKKALDNDPSHGAPQFYLGLAQLENGNTDEAFLNLKSVMNRSGNYAKESCWYLGLAYLKAGETVEAKECFEKLASTDGFYRKPAEKILRRLR
jgi:TolA-binding protein